MVKALRCGRSISRVRSPSSTQPKKPKKKFLHVSQIHVLVIKDTPMHSITKSALLTRRPQGFSGSWCISGMALREAALTAGVDSLTPFYPASSEPKFARNQEAGT